MPAQAPLQHIGAGLDTPAATLISPLATCWPRLAAMMADQRAVSPSGVWPNKATAQKELLQAARMQYAQERRPKTRAAARRNWRKSWATNQAAPLRQAWRPVAVIRLTTLRRRSPKMTDPSLATSSPEFCPFVNEGRPCFNTVCTSACVRLNPGSTRHPAHARSALARHHRAIEWPNTHRPIRQHVLQAGAVCGQRFPGLHRRHCRCATGSQSRPPCRHFV